MKLTLTEEITEIIKEMIETRQDKIFNTIAKLRKTFREILLKYPDEVESLKARANAEICDELASEYQNERGTNLDF